MITKLTQKRKQVKLLELISFLIGIAIVYLLQAYLYRKYWNYGLSAVVEFKKDAVNEGDFVTVEEKIENRKWLPLPMVKVKYTLSNSFIEKGKTVEKNVDCYNRNEIFSILMFQRIRRKVEFICSRRGVYRIKDVNILVGNLFLSETNFAEIKNEKKLTVYPKYVDINRFMKIYQNIYGNIITKQFMMEDPFMYRGVREYQIYDTIKSINWNASAKCGELKVNVLENTSQREVNIFLNIKRDTLLHSSEVSEEAIRLCKTFTLELYREGIKSSIYTNGRDIETDEIIRVENNDLSQNYADVVNDALARIVVKEGGNVHTENEADDFVSMYEALLKESAINKYIILISNYQRDDLQNLLVNIKNNNGDFKWIVPISNRNDYHVTDKLKSESVIWRMNWEGASGGSNK